MKRNLLFCLACWMTGASMMAGPIDLNHAKKIAAPFMSKGTTPEPVSAGVTKRAAAGAAPLYIFNRGNDQGYVIVSGDECMPEILGYTESGNFDADNMAPGFKAWLDYYSEMITAAQEAGAPAMVNKRAVTGRENIPVLLTSHWKQDWPYNNMAPWRNDDPNSRCLTGCVATAGAQVAYYWRNECYDRVQYATPTYGYGSPVTVSIPKGTPYKWELMQDRYGSAPEDYNEAVALVNYVMGTSAYLTYGASTGGYIWELRFSGQFGLHHTRLDKSSVSQDAYEKLIYDNLYMGRPMVYAGYTSDNSGHAIVLDGYQAANNLFHFNFGWGGNSDGYYTVQESGVNGFGYGQTIIHGIHPMHYNTIAKMDVDELGVRMHNYIDVSINNTCPGKLKGFYLVAIKDNGAPHKTPNSIDDPDAKDITTLIPGHSTATITLRYRPLTEGTYHLYLLDCNADVLDYQVVEAVSQQPELTLDAWELADGACTATATKNVEGKEQEITYHEVYGEQAVVTAQISNAETATVVTPTISYVLYRYDEESNAFVESGDGKESDTIFKSGEQQSIPFQLKANKKDMLYAVAISRDFRHTTSAIGRMEASCDTLLYFMMKEGDLTLTENNELEATLSGHWNSEIFASLTEGKPYAYYDMTQVTGFDKTPAANNPNALFAVAENSMATGDNLLKGHVCESLRLTKGYNFHAPAEFTAKSVSFNPDLTSTQWDCIVLPFDGTVNSGCMARKMNRLTAGTISNADSVNTTIQRGMPHLFRSVRPEEARITAADVLVSTAMPEGASDSIRGTFVTLPKGSNIRTLNKAESQEFTLAQTDVKPFNGYLNYGTNVSVSIASFLTKDKRNETFVSTMTEAYEVLEAYRDIVSEEALETFCHALEVAGYCFTAQPHRDVITAATEQLETDILKMKQGVVYGGDKVVDITAGYLANPSFEEKAAGWTIEKVSGQTAKASKVGSDQEDTMIGLDGNYLFHSFSASGKGSGSVSQTATGLLNGYYRVSAKIASDNGQSVTLFANDRTAEMKEDGFGKRYLTETIVDSVKVSDGTLNLGIKGNDGWYKVDDFRLYYIGGAETDIQEAAVETENLKVWGEYGCIQIQNTTHAPVCVNIYTLDGKEVKHLVVRDAAQVNGLARGIYIVNQEKVVVR